jgi:hypothetical protein
MENLGADPDIDGIIAETRNLRASGAMTVEAAIAGLNKIIVGLQQNLNLPEVQVRPIRDFIERLEYDNKSENS